jgi:hypothetical protein
VLRRLGFAAGLALLLGAAIALNPAGRSALRSLGGAAGASPSPQLDRACDRASHLAKLAWSAKEPEDRYQAAADGLDELGACRDPDQVAFGEAMLLSVKTEAEYKLQSGNAPYDSRRAIEALEACIARFRERLPKQARQCDQNRAAIATYFRGPPTPGPSIGPSI